MKYLNEDPEERHLHAAVLVYTALAKAFPLASTQFSTWSALL